MNKDDKISSVILVLLIVVAAILRLWNPFKIPFFFDEMSAIIRTHYSTLHDEIRNGVMLNDTHPAGVQVFLYYWTKLFGYKEIIVKLPFILCGIITVYYVFRLGKEWFNSTTGLVCAAYMATVQYTVSYSQFARPYASGMLLVILMVWYWYKMVFKPEQKYIKNAVLYVLFSALCAYNHHFSLLFAAIVGLTGLFFTKGKNLLRYLMAGICIFILYIPHLPVFLYQIEHGGVDWLAKPENAYIINYIRYILQFSLGAYIIAGLLFIVGLVNTLVNRKVHSPFYFISLFWFLAPFLIGFFYSRFVNPVIQYSVLIFSFPFMLYSFFGLLPNWNIKAKTLVVLVICSVNIVVLFNGRKYYDIYYQFHYDRQAALNDSLYRRVGGNNFIALSQSTPDSMMAFYNGKYHSRVNYVWIPDSGSEVPLIKYINSHRTPYLTYDNLALSNQLYLPVILDYYPYVAMAKYMMGGTNYIFTKNPADGKSPYVFESVNNFEKPCIYWSNADRSFITDTVSQSGKHAYRMDSLHEFASTSFNCDLDKMTTNPQNIILISVSVYPLETMKDVVIAASFDSGGKNLYWGASPVSNFINPDEHDKWVKAYHTLQLPGTCLNYKDIKVNIYIWNKGRRNFYIDDFTVRSIAGNPIAFGQSEKN